MRSPLYPEINTLRGRKGKTERERKRERYRERKKALQQVATR